MHTSHDINFKSFGNGDPVLILHGLFGMLDNWKSFARKLSEDYSVYIIDMPNHGKSCRMSPFNYRVMAEVIRQFMEDNWLFSASIIGHSMGGKAAMELSFEYPEMVDKLIVVDIAPIKYKGGHEKILKALQELNPSELENRQEARAFLEEALRDPPVVEFLLKNLSRKPDKGYRWKFALKTLVRAYQDILDDLGEDRIYEGPTLFVKGGRSGYFPEGTEPILTNFFPNHQLVEIADAGHWVHADQPEKLLHLAQGFLRS